MTAQVAVVEFRIAAYRGTVRVSAELNDEDKALIARAKAKVKRVSGLRPFGCETWRVLRREAADG